MYVVFKKSLSHKSKFRFIQAAAVRPFCLINTHVITAYIKLFRSFYIIEILTYRRHHEFVFVLVVLSIYITSADTFYQLVFLDRGKVPLQIAVPIILREY